LELLTEVLADRGKRAVEQGEGCVPVSFMSAIRIELPGEVSIRVKSRADLGLLEVVIERLRRWSNCAPARRYESPRESPTCAAVFRA
jgi:hypothetical protein